MVRNKNETRRAGLGALANAKGSVNIMTNKPSRGKSQIKDDKNNEKQQIKDLEITITQRDAD